MEAVIQQNYGALNRISKLIFSLMSCGKEQQIKIDDNKKYGTNRMPVWDREEVVLLVSEYFRTRNMSKSDVESSIEFVSKTLRRRAKMKGIEVCAKYRNITGIQMKFANVQSLDKDKQKQGCSGLKNVSTLEKIIVNEYYASPEKINQEAYYVIMKYAKL